MAGQVKVVEKPLFQGKIPSETTDAHACVKADAALQAARTRRGGSLCEPYKKSFFALQDIESQNFFSQDIGGTPLIHISTLLLSMYPHFVEMLWITPVFGHILSTNELFQPFLSPCTIVEYLLKKMLSTFLSTFFLSLTNLNNFYIYIKILITT